MRLRRLEMAVLMITLAFAFFMGGFFTGRSAGAVNVTATAQQQGERTGVQVSVSKPESERQSQTAVPASGDGDTAETQAPPASESETASHGTGEVRESDGKININTATKGELTDLPGIGDAIATRIIDYRTQNGNFANTEDIMNVSGIGEKRYEAIRDLIKVS